MIRKNCLLGFGKQKTGAKEFQYAGNLKIVNKVLKTENFKIKRDKNKNMK